MKIIRFFAENIKRIKAVCVTPTERCVIISGKNESGKSSVLDAIWMALDYRNASKENKMPLRAGTDKGLTELDLGDYIVTRKFTEKGTTLEIRTPDDNKVTSPQKLLDGLISSISFDPWAFARMKESEQRQALSDLLFGISGGKVDLIGFDTKKQAIFEKRTDSNKEVKRLVAVMANIKPPLKNEPTIEISVAELSEKLNIARKVDANWEEISKLRQRIDEMEAFNEIHAKPETSDVLQDQIINADKINMRIREISEYNKLSEALKKTEAESSRYTDEIELIDIEKEEALEASPLPTKDIIVDANGIQVINEEGYPIPFSQASSAKKLKVSLAIAMAGNPALRVIRIADGSLLDDDCMKIIETAAKEKDFQLWIEMAVKNEGEKVGVYIEDGQVVK